jgi:hypothetical protein
VAPILTSFWAGSSIGVCDCSKARLSIVRANKERSVYELGSLLRSEGTLVRLQSTFKTGNSLSRITNKAEAAAEPVNVLAARDLRVVKGSTAATLRREKRTWLEVALETLPENYRY